MSIEVVYKGQTFLIPDLKEVYSNSFNPCQISGVTYGSGDSTRMGVSCYHCIQPKHHHGPCKNCGSTKEMTDTKEKQEDFPYKRLPLKNVWN